MVTDLLLDGDELRSRLGELISSSTEIVIISAYITAPAIKWLDSLGIQNKRITIVGRLSPGDLMSGASDLHALRDIVKSGWQLRHLTNLHAKIYLLDDYELFVGSANLTSNGLKLSGAGNIEAVLEKVAEEKDLIFIQKIIDSATAITHEALNKMEALILDASKDLNTHQGLQSWPDDIFPCTSLLLVSDFPLSSPNVRADEYVSNPSLPFAIINGLEGNTPQAAELFKKSKAFKWLLNTLLQAEDNQMYFGAITACLHNSVADDPAPYRRSVKDILSNLLLYIDYLKIEEIEITRPSHSQLVRII
jgi:hypothetical protein